MVETRERTNFAALKPKKTAKFDLDSVNFENKMAEQGKFRRAMYIQRGSKLEIVNSFSIIKMYNYLSGTRCKPWDNRELDTFDGIKVFSYLVCTIGQAASCLLITWFYNIFNVFSVLRSIIACPIAMSNIAVEVFFFVSAFFTTYRCIMIMNAQDSVLTIGDYFKIILRKFIRLAPVYYTCWLFLWAATPNVVTGPLSYLAANNMISCSTDWVATLFMAGNIFVPNMVINQGCYQSSWPLQMDIQLTLIVPLVACLLWKKRNWGIALCFMLIIGNMFINYAITVAYDLKIGAVSQ